MTYKRKRCDSGECLRLDLESEIERLRAALRSVDCPAGGWTGMPSDIEATVGACVDHGVCGCSLGDALKK